jgi:hypothetical protein
MKLIKLKVFFFFFYLHRRSGELEVMSSVCGVPIDFFIGYDDSINKPKYFLHSLVHCVSFRKCMWDFFVKHCYGNQSKIDLCSSFFCGGLICV